MPILNLELTEPIQNLDREGHIRGKGPMTTRVSNVPQVPIPRGRALQMFLVRVGETGDICNF